MPRHVRSAIAVAILAAALAGGAPARAADPATPTREPAVALVLRDAAGEYRAADRTHDMAAARRVRALVAAAREAAPNPAAARALAHLAALLRATGERLRPWPLIAQVERLAALAASAAGAPPPGVPAPTATLGDVARTLGARGPARFAAALAWARYATGPRRGVQARDFALDARIVAAFWSTAPSAPGLMTVVERNGSRSGPALAQARERVGAQLAIAGQSLGQVQVSRGQIVTDAAVLVFREGLEAVLILAAITASFVGAKRRLRRPVLLGALAGLAASVLTWIAAQTVIRALGSGGLRLQAVTGLLAIAVLLLVTNWFFHRIYWSQWIARFNRRRRLLERLDRTGMLGGQAAGFVLLGLTSVYREGFETVLFLQSLQVSAGTGATLLGTAIGLAGTLLVGAATFLLQRKLPYRRMLVATGVLIALVLAVMVGTTAHTMQGIGWLPVTPTGFSVPHWCTTWLGLYPTWQSLAAQVAALVFVLGSYALARELQVRRPRRRSQARQRGSELRAGARP